MSTKPQQLNLAFRIILWVLMANWTFSLFGFVYNELFSKHNYCAWNILTVIFVVALITGAYLLSRASKVGFYLYFGGVLLVGAWNFVHNSLIHDYSSYQKFLYESGSFTPLTQTLLAVTFLYILMLLLMLLRHKGKNVYQVIWQDNH